MDFESVGTNYTHFGAVRSFTRAKQIESVLRTTKAAPESAYGFARNSVADKIQSVVRLERIGYDMYFGGNGRYLYQPIPKNGCTKIKSLLLQIENMPVDSNWWHVHQKEYNGFPGTHNLTLYEQLDIFHGRTDTFRFVFVRNPYARLASAYFDKLRKNIAPHIVRKIKTYARQNRIPLSDPITFSEFVTLVSHQSVTDMDSHFRP